MIQNIIFSFVIREFIRNISLLASLSFQQLHHSTLYKIIFQRNISRSIFLCIECSLLTKPNLILKLITRYKYYFLISNLKLLIFVKNICSLYLLFIYLISLVIKINFLKILNYKFLTFSNSKFSL